jgi:hypothetical protein
MSEGFIPSVESRVHNSPAYGRVLEMSVPGLQSWKLWHALGAVLAQEVARHQPQYLVLDLRALGSLYGMVVV